MIDPTMNVTRTLTASWSNLESKTRESSYRGPLAVDYETAYKVEVETLNPRLVIPSVFIVGDETILTPAGLEANL